MDTQRFPFLLMGLLSVVLAFGNAGTAVGDCLGHDGARGLGDAWTDSSPCIHKHREGVIVPVEPANSVPPLLSVNVDAEATFFSCEVRNFIVNVKAEFQVAGMPDTETNANLAVALPITTHALYGDHNRHREIRVYVENMRIR